MRATASHTHTQHTQHTLILSPSLSLSLSLSLSRSHTFLSLSHTHTRTHTHTHTHTQVWSETKGSGKGWSIIRQGSPGNLESFEEVVFEVLSPSLSLALSRPHPPSLTALSLGCHQATSRALKKSSSRCVFLLFVPGIGHFWGVPTHSWQQVDFGRQFAVAL